MDFSIIIPVYNAEKTIGQTVSSLFRQKPFDFSWEIIAVDDGSTDNSLSLLYELQKEAQKLGISFQVLTGENIGVAKTRERGLQKAQGEYVLYVDADDLLTENALSLIMTTAKEKEASIVVFDALFLYENGATSPFPMSTHPGGRMPVTDYMLSEPAPWNKLIRKSLFEENHLSFCPNIWYEDLSVIPALAENLGENDIYYLKTPLYLYYQSPGSITRSEYSPRRLDIFSALLHLKKQAKNHPEEVEYLAFYHLYHSFVWIFWQAGKKDAICRANAFMKEHFPRWKQNRLIKPRHGRKELFVANLFYRECFFIIRIWKGLKK